MTKYKEVKDKLKAHAEWVKVRYNGDKPAIREGINDYTDMITREYNLSNRQKDLLYNYAAKLHPR